MMQVVEQTHEEKMAMYMKSSKKELAEMLIECNRIIEAQGVRAFDMHQKVLLAIH